jgi:protocatechuate 3,4-dioxygenase beta subunit
MNLMAHDHEGQRVSRRTLFAGLTSLGFGGVLAACGNDDKKVTRTDLVGLFSDANVCALTPTATQGPYYFDADRMRSDIREDRPGKRLRLAIRLQDSEGCAPIGGAVVEIWHCDATGIYSGAESQSTGGGGEGMPSGGPGGSNAPGAPPAPQDSPADPGALPPSGLPGPNDVPPPGAGVPSGMPGAAPAPAPGVSPTAGSGPAAPPRVPGVPGPSGAPGGELADMTPTDDKRYLRGAQVTGKDGIVEFVTVWPGWYFGRTVHIHVMVHVAGDRVLTTQLMFDETLNAKVFAEAPYATHTGRDTLNDNDTIFRDAMLLTVSEDPDGYLGVIALAADTDRDGT